MFSITTMASSTTSPVASVMPKSVSVLMEKPNNFTKAKVPISETGMAMAGIIVVRQSCRKMKITRMTSTIADQREEHITDRFAHRVGGIERELVMHPRRKTLR